ncbi:MAG: HAMP domain-containing sensor histidine kinase [Chitinophagaceae bacterium]
MRKGIGYIFIVCILATVGVVCLQIFWLRNFYKLNEEQFVHQANMAFEDAVKKEFSIRNDTIEAELFRFLMDTTEIRITSEVNQKSGEMMYLVTNVHDSKDAYSFSQKDLNFPIVSQLDSNKAKVAKVAAKLDREEDLDHHIIFYRTQNLGRFLHGKADMFSFDTSRLRPILQAELRQRYIQESFVFSLKDSDNTLNGNAFPDSLTSKYPVITKALPTFKNTKGSNFVRAYFLSPSNYLIRRTAGVLTGSVMLLLSVGFAFYYLIYIIRRQKKLSLIKNDFINHITHEFKTPIATVYGAVQALDDFDLAKDTQKAKKYLQISKTELERLSDLVTKVLHISLHERPNFRLDYENVVISELIQEVIAVHQQSISNGSYIKYTNDVGSSIAHVDRMHMYNSINNLIDNAVKYSLGEPRITITLEQMEKWLVLSVKDEGRGIAIEHQHLVFNSFYRVPETSDQVTKGFGLGLNYTKQIIEKHGGWCKVESELGKGATFQIAIPRGV